ncbi:MAG: SAM-dependent methyltransferase, partial [Streptosporangiaceae bacterium]
MTCPGRLYRVDVQIRSPVPDFDTSVPHIARVYDYWLGGKDNFAADRELGERT